MEISKSDYVVAKEGGKHYLARALEDSTGAVEAVLEKMIHISRSTLTIEKKDILLNLGPKPHHGKVYGLDVTNLYCGNKTHTDFGVVYFFYKPDKEVVKNLWEAMTKVHKILEKRGLAFLLENVVWEVLPYHNEKYAGMYIKAKKDKVPDRIQIRPEIMPASLYTYVLLHEIGHRLHLRFLESKKLKALWVRLFNTSIKVASVRKEASSNLLESLLSQEDVPSAFKSSLDEEDALAYKWIVRSMGTTHGVTIKELDLLFEAEMYDDIRKLWPVRNIPHKELAPIISEYATKNHKETFAEAFSYYLTNKKLPEGIVKLLDRSISNAKTQNEPQ